MPPDPYGFDAAAHERHHGRRRLLLKLVACGGASALLWWVNGRVGLLLSLMLWGLTFASDLMDFGAVLWRGLRHQAFRPVQGHLYQFKGERIRVEDDELLPQRWIALDDLARALGAPMPASVIGRRQPEVLRQGRDGTYVLDEAALDWLRARRSDRAGQLAWWVEREVWYPARGRKASYKEKGAPAPQTGAPED